MGSPSAQSGTPLDPARRKGAIAPKSPKERRILIVDDNDEIHNDFKRILCPPADTSELDTMEELLFGKPRDEQPDANFEITSAHQGAEALEKVRKARAAGAPYMLIFMDVRMPPGWDGVETLSRIWQEDPDVQGIICSAYLDYSWQDIAARFPGTDRLLILKKPFEPIEVRQMAYALTEKWNQNVALVGVTRRLTLQYMTTLRLVEATSIAEGVRGLLAAVGQAYELPFGALWLTDGQRLFCSCTWSAPTGDFAALEAFTQSASSAPGEGWPDQALRGAAASFIASVGVTPGDVRAAKCSAAGIQNVLEFPILRGDAKVGAIELMSRSPDAPSGELLEVMAEICPKVGQFIEARRADAAAEQQRLQVEMIRVQAQALSALSTPLIPIHEDILVMPLIGEMDAARARQMHEKLIRGIAERRARVAILDVTGLPSLRPEVADELIRTARAVRLLGSQIVLTGIHPAVAQTLVKLNIDLSDIPTLRSLESGIAYAMKQR